MKRLLAILLAIPLSACGSVLEDRVQALPISVMPSGMRLQTEVPKVQVAQIEAGIAKANRKARCQGYKKELELSDYKVAVIKPSSIREGTGVIEHNGGYAAGVYLTGIDTLVLVEQSDMTGIAEHEATHRVYLWNDRARYGRTKDHPPDFFMPDC